MKLKRLAKQQLITFLACMIIMPVIYAETFQILAKSTSIRELEDEILTIHKQAIASNIDIKIIGDILEDHSDLKTSITKYLDVKGKPARVELTDDKQQLIIVTADHIIYDVEIGQITATTKAHIAWNNSYIKGNKIIYKVDGTMADCFGIESISDDVCEFYRDSKDFSNE